MRVFSLFMLMLLWVVNLQAANLKTTVFTASTMNCEKCATKIEAQVSKEAGVTHVLTMLEDKSVTITYDTAKTDDAKLIASMAKAGYKAVVAADNDIHCKKGTKVMGECCAPSKDKKKTGCCGDELTKAGSCCISGAKQGAKCCVAQIKKAEANAKKQAQ